MSGELRRDCCTSATTWSGCGSSTPSPTNRSTWSTSTAVGFEPQLQRALQRTTPRPSKAPIHALKDSWTSAHHAEQTYNDFWMTAPEKPKQMLKAMVAALGEDDVTAYLSMMAPRLVELHRVLKPTGSLYLHCDPTASHYLKVLLDSIFEGRRLRQRDRLEEAILAQRRGARISPLRAHSRCDPVL